MGTTEAVQEYYDQNAEGEWRRLERHRIEFEITKRILEKFLPPGPWDILDAGGGPGRYSLWLAGKGHRVTLFDLAPSNVAKARAEDARQGGTIAGFLVGDVLHLDRHLGGAKFDAVLLMGPLYHLVDEADRVTAVTQALHALKDGGLLAVAFISGYAPLLDVLKHCPEELNGRLERYLGYLSDGVSRVSGENPGFTDAHFMHPSGIEAFLAPFPLEKLGLFNTESLLGPFERTLEAVDEETFQTCLTLAMHFVEDKNGFACGEHFLYVGRKRSTGSV